MFDIDLASVPLVNDFAVELRELEEMGQIVHFTSARHGELAWFPAWEHADRDLRHMNPSDVPMGVIEAPYDDGDDGWRIVIFQEGEFVYVFEDDRPNGTIFPRRWKIPVGRYVAAWAALLSMANPIVPLDDADDE